MALGFGPSFRAPINQWMGDHFRRDGLLMIALRTQLEWTPSPTPLLFPDRETFGTALWKTDDTHVLVALDAALYQLAGKDRLALASLGDLLEAGGSAWTVRADGCGLEKRVPDEIRTAATVAVSSATRVSPDAAEHLTKAWTAIYGVKPDPSEAYAEAVRAVESAAGRLVEPNNSKATLGTINGTIRANQGTWSIAITDNRGQPIDGGPVLAMQELLWRGHTDRHGANPTIKVTSEAAGSAVHLAALLARILVQRNRPQFR